MAKERTVRTLEREIDDDKVDEVLGNNTSSTPEDPNPNPAMASEYNIPLLPNVSIEDMPKVMELCITRLAPSPGYLGNHDITLTLSELKDKFGGKRINIKAITRGHRYVKGGSETYDIAAPAKDIDVDQDDRIRDSSGDPKLDLILDGLGSVDSKLDNGRRSDSSNSLLSMFLTKSDTETKLAEIKLEELQIRQKEERDRFEKEISLKEKDIDTKLEIAKQEIDLKKAQIEADKNRVIEEAKLAREAWDRKVAEDEKRRKEEKAADELRRKEEKDNDERRRKEERDEDRRRDERKEQERKDELLRMENERKLEIDRMKAEQKDREERDRQWRASEAERSEKFQTLMATLSKQEKTSPLETLELISTVREMFGGSEGEEKEESPMQEIMKALPPLAMAFASRLGGGGGQVLAPRTAMQRRPPAVPATTQSNVPATTQTNAISTKSKRGGRRMAKQATATAPEQAQAAVPIWAQALAFCLQHMSVEIIGDAVFELNDDEDGAKTPVINDDMFKQLTESPEAQFKLYFTGIHKWFSQPAVWAKIMAVREYLNNPPDEDEEQPEIQPFAFNIPASSSMPEEKKEAPKEEAKETANVQL